jgi:hypothetical protein
VSLTRILGGRTPFSSASSSASKLASAMAVWRAISEAKFSIYLWMGVELLDGVIYAPFLISRPFQGTSFVVSSLSRFSRNFLARSVRAMSFLSSASFFRKPCQMCLCFPVSSVLYVRATEVRDKKASSICPMRFVVYVSLFSLRSLETLQLSLPGTTFPYNIPYS